MVLTKREKVKYVHQLTPERVGTEHSILGDSSFPIADLSVCRLSEPSSSLSLRHQTSIAAAVDGGYLTHNS